MLIQVSISGFLGWLSLMMYSGRKCTMLLLRTKVFYFLKGPNTGSWNLETQYRAYKVSSLDPGTWELSTEHTSSPHSILEPGNSVQNKKGPNTGSWNMGTQ
jgi:hypothetical protein